MEKKTQHLLRDVDDGVQFHFVNGRSARNLRELLSGLESLDEKDYHHHVYFDHNDFSNWLLDVVGDEKLARDLFTASLRQARSLVQGRIHFLEN